MVEKRSPDGASQRERAEALQELLAERILVLDGATGTWMQGQDLTAEDFGGPELEGCNENLVLTRPDVVRRMHEEYFAAGADMVETNTFGGTPLVLAEYGLADKALEINRRAAEIAREAAAKCVDARADALRRGLDGPDDQGDDGHRRRDLRRDDRALPDAGARAALGRRRHAAARDDAGHAQPQGRA